MVSALEVLKRKKNLAELAFKNAEDNLTAKQRVHESIIIKTSLITVKRSETPAEAAAEAVMDELKDVLNDARIQHYTSTTEVVNGKLAGETKRQQITNAKILAVRSLSFMNEGDSIRVKIAFRVRTILDAKKTAAPGSKTPSSRYSFADLVPPKTQIIKKSAKKLTKKHKPQRFLYPAKHKRRIAKHRIAIKLPAKKELPLPVNDDNHYNTSISTSTMKLGPYFAAKNILGFIFKLDKVSKIGTNLIFWLDATNEADHVQYLAFYDESSTYARSSITTSSHITEEVNQVYFLQGNKKTPASDAYRGIPLQPNTSVTVEFIFKKTPPETARIALLKFIPTVGRRILFGIYKWRSGDIPWKNISVP